MKFLHKYGTRSIEIERARKELYLWIFMAGAALMFFALMILFAKLRPGAEGNPAGPENTPQSQGMQLTDSERAEKRQEVRNNLQVLQEKFDSNSFDFTDMDILEELIVIQGTIRSASHEDEERFENLLALRDEAHGQLLHSQSRLLEEEADRQNREGLMGDALDSLKEATNLQKKINEEYPRSTYRAPSRLHQLERKLILWQTEPIARRADNLKEEALELRFRGQFGEALDKMKEAMEAQRQLQENFRASPFASLSRTREFERAWQQIQVAERASDIQSLITRAKSFLELQQAEAALEAAKEAENLQREIMTAFPALPESRREILDEILVLRDTAASKDDFDRLVQLGEVVSRKLRDNDIENINNTLSGWLRACEAFARTYPLSEFIEEINFEKVDFLHGQRTEIPALLIAINANLLPVPGQPETLLYRTEVPQALYEKITGKNPSSDRDPLKPVESVTWEEAVEFTRLMSWILAKTVHLPTREAYLNALGHVDSAGKIWSAESSGRETSKIGLSDPNRDGFVDLVGNVSEWLSAEDPGLPPSAVAIGGSARDSREQLHKIPEEKRQPGERNRFIGFRFAVQSP